MKNTLKNNLSSKIVLEFMSPNELNSLATSIEKKGKLWKYIGEEDSNLVLDISDWTIECDKKAIKTPITDWVVDESQYTMKIKDDSTDGNFEDLSYSFAVSMIGQLVDKNELVRYLSSLQTIFLNVSPRSSNEDELSIEQKDN